MEQRRQIPLDSLYLDSFYRMSFPSIGFFMQKRPFNLIEVIASLTIVAVCFGLAMKALGTTKRLWIKQSAKVASGLDRLYVRNFLMETLGQAKPAFLPVGVLGDKKGIAFFFENFADPEAKLCGGVIGVLSCNASGILSLDIREFDAKNNLVKSGRTTSFLKGIKSWKLEVLDLKKSKEWIQKRSIVLSDLCDAVRLTFQLKDEKITLVVNLAYAPEVVLGAVAKVYEQKNKECV